MPSSSGPYQTRGSNLVFNYDVGDVANSYIGRPTDNLLANAGMSIYNNVGGDVSITLTQTSDFYKGASIWKEVITPTTGNGVSYLTNGNNPGIGVVTSGGGGLANTYTGHSIFFKPTGTMYGIPIYLAYSNIGGWQCNTCPPEDMGDGWFRAKVLWYDTVTRTDGKFWAINPANAIINNPITVYWAGPFKESLNSTTISQFVNGTRTMQQGLLDISGRGKSIDLSSVSFDSSAQIIFDGTDDFINVNGTIGTLSQYTVEHVSYYQTVNRMPIASLAPPIFYQYGDNSWYYTHGGVGAEYYYPKSFTINGWGHWAFTYDGAYLKVYRNGVYEGQQATTGTANWGSGIKIGNYTYGGYPWNGQIAAVKLYDRALSQSEITRNYNSYKKRFNLS